MENRLFSIASVYCLQDVHFTKDMEQFVGSEWGLACFFSSFRSNSRGVVILFNNNVEYKAKWVKKDEHGNLLIVDLEIGDYKITLVNLYGPKNDDPGFYDHSCTILNDLDSTHIILCGDFNLVLSESLDCVNYVNLNNPLARNRVLNMCNDFDLLDVWRVHNPDSRRYTWRQHQTLKQSRLDYFLISSELNSKFTSCDIKPGYRTYHSLIDIKFDFSDIERGQGYWKFNNSLLMDKIYVDVVKDTMWDLVEEHAVSPYLRSNLRNMHP